MSLEEEDFIVGDVRESLYGICDNRGWLLCHVSPEGHLVASQQKGRLARRGTLRIVEAKAGSSVQ